MIFLLALIIRLIYLWQYYGTPFYLVPMWDAAEYYNMAEALSRGQSHVSFAYRPPLYPLFIALSNLIFGVSLLWFRIIQIILGSFACMLIMKFGERLFDRRAGIAAGVIASLSGLMFFYDLEFSPTSLILLLNLLFLWEMLEVVERDGSPIQAGLYFGLGLLAWPIALPFLPVALIWIYLNQRRIPYFPTRSGLSDAQVVWRKRLKSLSVPGGVLAGLLIPLILSLFLHIAAGWGTVMLSGHGGVNFYIGNNRNADGISANLPGIGVGWDWKIVHNQAEAATGERLNIAQVDDFYWKQGFSEIAADPLRWITLMIRKALLFWNHTEISNNQDFYYHAHKFPLFGRLMWLGFPLMLIPAFMGLVAGWQKRGVKLFGFFLLIYFIAVTVFFVNARFRHPVTPLLIILAAGGISYLIRQRSLLSYKRWSIIAAAGLIGAFLPFAVDSRINTKSFDYGYFTEGNAWERIGDLQKAEESYLQAAKANPTAPYVHFKLGELYREQRDHRKAEEYYRLELANQPDYSKAWNNLGIVLLESGRDEDALSCFMRAAVGRPPMGESVRNAARIWGERGLNAAEADDWRSAKRCMENALELMPTDPMYRTMQLRCCMMLEEGASIRVQLNDLTAKYPDFPPAVELMREFNEKERKKTNAMRSR